MRLIYPETFEVKSHKYKRYEKYGFYTLNTEEEYKIERWEGSRKVEYRAGHEFVWELIVITGDWYNIYNLWRLKE